MTRSDRNLPVTAARRRWLRWKSWRFLQLLVFMVAVLLLNPLQASHPLLIAIMQLLVLNGLLVSLSAAGFPPRTRGALFAVWLVFIALDAAPRIAGDPALAATFNLPSHLVGMILLTGCTLATLRYVLLSRQVSTDTLSAAVVAYMFIGLTFASAYYCLVVLDPHSFAIPSDMPVADSVALETAMIYFSYVTLATLGYGDIAPRLPLPQTLAVLEAIVGQFYIAVVIAWLVSVYAASRTRLQKGGSGDT
jgi:voltage-gated potassium channel